MSDYILREVGKALERPTRGEVLERLSAPWTCSVTSMSRCWGACGSLRENLTAYDAVYVALAEALDSVLLTCDGPLSRAPGLTDRVVLIQAKRQHQ